MVPLMTFPWDLAIQGGGVLTLLDLDKKARSRATGTVYRSETLRLLRSSAAKHGENTVKRGEMR